MFSLNHYYYYCCCHCVRRGAGNRDRRAGLVLRPRSCHVRLHILHLPRGPVRTCWRPAQHSCGEGSCLLLATRTINDMTVQPHQFYFLRFPLSTFKWLNSAHFHILTSVSIVIPVVQSLTVCFLLIRATELWRIILYVCCTTRNWPHDLTYHVKHTMTLLAVSITMTSVYLHDIHYYSPLTRASMVSSRTPASVTWRPRRRRARSAWTRTWFLARHLCSVPLWSSRHC